MTSRRSPSRFAHRRSLVAGLALAAVAAPAAHASAEPPGRRLTTATATTPSHALDLGPADLPESRSTTALQPGVTLTRITRGSHDPDLSWTSEIAIPATSGSPDPDAPPRSISDQASARAEVDRLRSEGFDPRVEAVRQPRVADVAAGVLGYRVRVGRFATKAEAEANQARLAQAGETAGTVYTGWDGDASDRGPWHVDVLTIDPRRFTGDLSGSFGPDLYRRETTSQLARSAAATAAVNGGFFVLDPAAGAPGDPAGVGVYDGRVLSETVGDRPALVLRDGARHTAVTRLDWVGTVRLDGARERLDGVDRVPGLIRNCGGDATDSPTSLPLHDLTCTDDSELVAFTPDYGVRTPAGPGREVVLQHDRVVAVHDTRGTALAPGQTSVQGTGDDANLLTDVRIGDALPLALRLTSHGHPLATPRHTSIVNGGPLLVRRGRVDITQRRDGFVHPDDPSFQYGWFIKRNPRTFAGVDARGRTVLVTIDGRTADDLGASIPEAADVARSLGLVDALNLDGGGSTTMVVVGQVVNHPSDASGERPVGDAILVRPR